VDKRKKGSTFKLAGLNGKTLKFAFRDVDLEVSDSRRGPGDHWGLAIYDDGVIWLDPEIPSSNLCREILFHEVAHFLMYFMNEFNLRGNEKFISQLGRHLEVFFRKNFDLLKKLNEKG